MGSITLTFAKEINESLQINDAVYYYNGTNTIKLGTCSTIGNDRLTLTCGIDDNTVRPTASNLILFSKDNLVNTSSIRGYYAEIELKNNSSSQVELFSVGAEVFESSK